MFVIFIFFLGAKAFADRGVLVDLLFLSAVFGNLVIQFIYWMAESEQNEER